MRTSTIFLSAGVLAALAAGCNTSQPSTPPTSTATTTVNTPAATTTTTANGATATTTTTPNPDTKIDNNAGPGTSSGTDDATADAVNTAIVHNKEMTGSRVDVVVTDGVARLNGTVQNQQQKALAYTTASKVAGVTSVVNKLIIDATGGIHSASSSAPTKVISHTTVINHYITVPSEGGASGGSMSGGSSSSASGGGASSSSAAGGGGVGAEGTGTDNGGTGTTDNGGTGTTAGGGTGGGGNGNP